MRDRESGNLTSPFALYSPSLEISNNAVNVIQLVVKKIDKSYSVSDYIRLLYHHCKNLFLEKPLQHKQYDIG